MNGYMGSVDLRDRPMGELIKDLGRHIGELVRHEFRLAIAELEEKGKAAGAGVGLFGLGAIFALAAFACLTAALVAFIAAWLGIAGASLVVGVGYAIIAAAFVVRGRREFKKVHTVVPEAALHSVKEDLRWVASRTRSEKTS